MTITPRTTASPAPAPTETERWSPPDAPDVAREAGGARVAIDEALDRNARVDAHTVTVTEGPVGTITLTGTIRSWGERRQAEQACWSVPGVVGVIDHLQLVR